MKDSFLFVDTNILVYAHDVDAMEKHITARRLVEGLWKRDRPPSLSIQVLQELYVNLIKKEIPDRAAQETVQDYLEWHVIENDRGLLLNGIEEKQRWQISFWDGLILAAARRAGAEVIWSEDLNANQDYGGILVVNPLPQS